MTNASSAKLISTSSIRAGTMLRKTRRTLLAGATMVVTALVLAHPAVAASGEVIVRAGGDDVVIRLADLGAADIDNSSYKLETGWETASGFSLRRLLGTAAGPGGFQIASILSVEIDADGGTRMIPRTHFDAGPPIFFEQDGVTSWILPGRAGGPGRQFDFANSPPVVRAVLGRQFKVTLTASPAKIAAGETVQFRATVDGQQAGDRLTYAWSFGDGQSRTAGARSAHRFKRQGRYLVSLDVTSAKGGGSGTTTVQVGRATKPKPTEPTKKKQPNTEGAGTGSGGTGGSGSSIGSVSPSGAPAGSADASQQDRRQPKLDRPSGGQDGLNEVRGALIDLQHIAPAIPMDGQRSATDANPDQGGSALPEPFLLPMGILALLTLGGSAELLTFRRLG